MPGVGIFSALCVQAEIGSIDRFHSSHALAAYAGLVSTTRSSGGKTAHGGLGTANNRWLKWILVEIVITLKLAPGPVGTYYRHLLRAKGKPTAQTAAARKLCCYVRRFSFALVYRIAPDESLRILAVAHLERRPGYWRTRT